ncbi:MAG TPA: Hsp20/alpha crystallin family protein [Vicinamibacterales bacterium]|jgi:HSP20 family protein|nr:Hsp20/alpha crystallin family protein [Vicinamibacterales bacterium]
MSSDPLRDLLSLPDRLDRLSRREGAGWLPPVDVYETGDRYVVSVELPGMDQRDIEIDAREGELWLRGRRPVPAVAPHAYHQMERGHGLFERRFLFAEAIDVQGTSAEMRDGVLTVTVPKRGPKRIEIR